MEVDQCINIQRLHWLGYNVQIEEDASASWVFGPRIYRNRQRGRSCVDRSLRWKDSYRLVRPTGIGAQAAEMSGRLCYGRPESVNRIVNGGLSKYLREYVSVE